MVEFDPGGTRTEDEETGVNRPVSPPSSYVYNQAIGGSSKAKPFIDSLFRRFYKRLRLCTVPWRINLTPEEKRVVRNDNTTVVLPFIFWGFILGGLLAAFYFALTSFMADFILPPIPSDPSDGMYAPSSSSAPIGRSSIEFILIFAILGLYFGSAPGFIAGLINGFWLFYYLHNPAEIKSHGYPRTAYICTSLISGIGCFILATLFLFFSLSNARPTLLGIAFYELVPPTLAILSTLWVTNNLIRWQRA